MKHRVLRKLVVRARTVSLSVRYCVFYCSFLHTLQINDDVDDDNYYTLTDVINVFLTIRYEMLF